MMGRPLAVGLVPASSSKPRLLLIATLPWIFPARLAIALRRVGFEVEAVCQAGHPLRHLSQPIRTHGLAWLREAASIAKAIEHADPDLLLPCDDPAVTILHGLHGRDRAGKLSRLIEKSLGNPRSFMTAANRSALIDLARSMGLPAPRSNVVADRCALAAAAGYVGYPCVLKRDRTWSGFGVKVVRSPADLRMAWSWVAGGISLLRAGRAMLRDRRLRTLLDAVAARACKVELQEFVAGVSANRAVLCRNGKVLAGLSVLALQTAYPEGPASLVRIVDNPQMVAVAEALVDRLGLSGLCGFDFVVAPCGRTYLLELNPRATPICHLALAHGTHLPAALYRELTGWDPADVPDPLPGDLIALFPTEWQRDPSDAARHGAHHDVPWDEPALLARAGLPRDHPMPAKRPALLPTERRQTN